MTSAEVRLWIYLKGKSILGYKFRRQYSVEKYILDFYCPALKLAIEVDGAKHLITKKIKLDRERQEKIESLGITFLRFTGPEIYKNIDTVIEKIITLQKKIK